MTPSCSAAHAADYGKTGHGASTSGGVGRDQPASAQGKGGVQLPFTGQPEINPDMSEQEQLRERVAAAGDLAGQAEATAEENAMTNQRETMVPSAVEAATAAAAVQEGHSVYSLAELQASHKGSPQELQDVDHAHKEQHLDDATFTALFKTSRADFAKLPQWKQKDMKKAHKIW